MLELSDLYQEGGDKAGSDEKPEEWDSLFMEYDNMKNYQPRCVLPCVDTGE